MSEMKFIDGTNAGLVSINVNKALKDGFEYLETLYQGTDDSSFILVILRKD